MQAKAPLEYVWRPLFAAIADLWRSIRFFPDSLLLPIVIWGAAIFLIIVWVLSA